MTGRLRVTILGCGSSGGVPRIGPDGAEWGACDPANPLNRRRRCALLVQRLGPGGTTTVLVDSGPDIAGQLIDAGAGLLDAVLYTHDHADHVHGIDDLRMVAIARRARVPAWMTEPTERILRARFGYIFETPPGSSYPPVMTAHRIDGPVTVDGPGGPITALPFEVIHGDVTALGFRFGPVAYLPDVSEMTEAAWAACAGLDCWILDTLRLKPHPSHVHLDRALEWIARAAPRRAVLTNLHVDLDHGALDAATPAHVTPAHDGMVIEFGL